MGPDGETRAPVLVLLPGLHGTSELFAPLIDALPREIEALPIEYPRREALGYSELLEYVRALLPSRPYVLLAESFSGPLGVMLAAEAPDSLRALVLCATFLRSPVRFVPAALAPLGARLVRWRPSARLAARYLLARKDTPPSLVRQVTTGITAIDPVVVARRLREALEIDVTQEYRSLGVPVSVWIGGQDRVVSRSARARFQLAPDTASLHHIDAPHLIVQAEPKAAVAALLALYDRLKSE